MLAFSSNHYKDFDRLDKAAVLLSAYGVFAFLFYREKMGKLKYQNTLTTFLNELILGLEEEVAQGIITTWQCSKYTRLTEIALERILYNYPSFKEVQASMTECKLKFISD